MSFDTEQTKRRWYVIHTYSGYENKVKANLERKVHSMGMENQIFDIVVPMDVGVEKKDGKTRATKKKVFPGYALVDMIVNDRSWYVVRNTPGVTGFVGSGIRPIPLTDEEVKKILKTSQEDIRPIIEIDLSIGEKVRIISGPFEHQLATVEEIFPASGKIKVLAGQGMLIELDYDMLEKI